MHLLSKGPVLAALYKTRWLWVCTFCAALWLGIFMALILSGVTRPVQASPAITTELSTVAFNQPTLVVSEGIGSAKIVLVVDPPSSTPITLTVSSSSIQAEADLDFLGLRDKLVIAPGIPAYTLSLTILDDHLVEGTEQLRLTLGELQGVLLGAISETVVSIVDNDIAYLSIGDTIIDEEAEIVTLLITQSITSTLESVVNVRTVDGSATAPEDYAELFTTASIPAGSTQTLVSVQLHGDELVEGVEEFFVRLEDSTNSQIAKMTATVRLIDDDFYPAISLEDAAANEMEGRLFFVARLSVPSMQTVTVEYATRDGSAIAPNDYLQSSGVLTFAPGSTMATVAVTLLRDNVEEAEETFFLRLANPVQATLGISEAKGIILDGFKEFILLPRLGR